MTKAKRKEYIDEIITNLATVSKWAIEARKDESKLHLQEDTARELGGYCAILSLRIYELGEPEKRSDRK